MIEDNFDFLQYTNFFDDLTDFEEQVLSDLDYETDDGIVECPFLPLRDLVLFPQMVMPLFIGRDRSLAAVQAAVSNGERLVVSAHRDPDVVDPL